MRIGLFGGTFDPVHNAHIKIAEHAIDEVGLDEVWFLADKIPRRKNNSSDHMHRLSMLKHATSHNSKLISEITDMHKDVDNYNSMFFLEITKKYPSYSFYIILGSDSAQYLKHWENIEFYKDKATFLIVNRGEHLTEVPPQLKYLTLNIYNQDLSASQIRNNLDLHKTNLNQKVYKYIKDNSLY